MNDFVFMQNEFLCHCYILTGYRSLHFTDDVVVLVSIVFLILHDHSRLYNPFMKLGAIGDYRSCGS